MKCYRCFMYEVLINSTHWKIRFHTKKRLSVGHGFCRKQESIFFYVNLCKDFSKLNISLLNSIYQNKDLTDSSSLCRFISATILRSKLLFFVRGNFIRNINVPSLGDYFSLKHVICFRSLKRITKKGFFLPCGAISNAESPLSLILSDWSP